MTIGDTQATAAPQPDATLRQKTREGEAAFAFRPDRLDYDFADRKGTKVHRQIPWNVVPPRFRLKGRARMNGLLIRLARGAAMVLIFVFCTQFRLFGLAPILALAALVFFGLTILFSRQFRLEHAVLGTSAGNIVILGDDRRDEILDQIMLARRNFLGRFAAMDRQRTLRWNLQRLRWLTEQDVLTAEDFAKAQRNLLPGLADTLLHRPPATPDRRIEQHFFNSLFAFDFKPDHLAYRRRTALGNEYRENVFYRDLKEPSLDVQTASPSQLQPFVLIWSGIVAFGCVFDLANRFPAGAFDGPEGLQNLLMIFGPVAAAFALAVFCAKRFLRVVCTKLPSGITILKDKRHDAIFAELKQRRRQALEAMIEPDPLLSPDEQASRYETLRNLGVLDAARVPQLLTRASALQAHLGLVDPKPTTAATMPGEERRHETPPQVTLH